MKFSVNIGAFIKAISPVLEVSSKNSLKEFDGVGKVNFEVKDKKELILSAFGGKTAIEAKLSDITVDGTQFEFDLDGKVTIEVEFLSKTLSSFDPLEKITFSYNTSGNKELIICKKSDTSESQTLPTCELPVDLPDKADKFSKTMKIKRDIFLSGSSWINFAIGLEEQTPTWLYWPLRVAGNKKIRFIAGYGGRLAGKDIEGSDLIDCSPATSNFLFSKDHTPLINKLLNSVTDESIEIKQSDPKNGPYQMILKTSTYELTLTNMVPNIQWPDENVLINLPYNQKFIIKISDLQYAAKGAVSTFHDGLVKERKPHIAHVCIDFVKKNMIIETKEIMKSARKVPILDASSSVDNISFKCVSMFLNEIGQHGDKDGYVQIEALGPDKPMLVHYNAINKVSDPINFKKVSTLTKIAEKTFIIFAPLVKDC